MATAVYNRKLNFVGWLNENWATIGLAVWTIGLLALYLNFWMMPSEFTAKAEKVYLPPNYVRLENVAEAYGAVVGIENQFVSREQLEQLAPKLAYSSVWLKVADFPDTANTFINYAAKETLETTHIYRYSELLRLDQSTRFYSAYDWGVRDGNIALVLQKDWTVINLFVALIAVCWLVLVIVFFTNLKNPLWNYYSLLEQKLRK